MLACDRELSELIWMAQPIHQPAQTPAKLAEASRIHDGARRDDARRQMVTVEPGRRCGDRPTMATLPIATARSRFF
jgi:hypothetical protein